MRSTSLALFGLRPFRIALLLLLLLPSGVKQAAAVSVSPVALYLDHRARAGTLTLYNEGSLPEEITIDFAFGIPASDSAGTVRMDLQNVAPDGEPSALGWLRAFPRRLVLEPGQRQVIRVLIDPPASLAEGEYWARLLVRSRGGQPPIEQAQGDVTMRIDVETVVVVAANYRHGTVATGVRAEGSSVRRTDAEVVADLDLVRTGNAAFVGRVRAELLDGAGRMVAEQEQHIAVYHALRTRFSLPAGQLPAGDYSVRFVVDTKRDDLPPGGPLPAETLRLVASPR